MATSTIKNYMDATPVNISSQCSWNTSYFPSSEAITAWRVGNVVQVRAYVKCTNAHGTFMWVDAITGLPEVAGESMVQSVLGATVTVFSQMFGTRLCVNLRESSTTYAGYLSMIYICK